MTRYQRIKAKAMARGLCVRCGSKKEDLSKIHCNGCAFDLRIYNRQRQGYSGSVSKPTQYREPKV